MNNLQRVFIWGERERGSKGEMKTPHLHCLVDKGGGQFFFLVITREGEFLARFVGLTPTFKFIHLYFLPLFTSTYFYFLQLEKAS